MSRKVNSSIQNLLNADMDSIAISTQKTETASKNRVPIIIGATVLVILVLFVIVKGFILKETGTYRGVRWGMTKDEIEKLETRRGNRVFLSDNDTVMYDLIDEDASCSYRFDGENETLSSFSIWSGNNGRDLFLHICDDLDGIYGKGEYDSTEAGGKDYYSAQWNNQHESITGLLISDKAYFTFTYQDD